MKKRLDVMDQSELLVGFVENCESDQKNSLFEEKLGGAPCNMLAMLTWEKTERLLQSVRFRRLIA